MPTRVTIALGSNLGERHTTIAAAIAELKAIAVANAPFLVAPLIETKPVNCPPGSPDFLNTVVDFWWPGDDPWALLAITQSIERKHGRVPSPVANAPRPIDLDILLFGELEVRHPTLTLPHPRLLERPFVLEPLRQIRPELVAQLETQARPLA